MFSRFHARWNAPQGYREVMRVGLPLVAGMISSTVMQFTDRLFLSHYSVTSIAAALPSAMAAMVLQLPLVGLCGYVSVFIAHYVGAGRHKQVGSALWQGLWMAFAGTLILACAFSMADSLFAWIGHPAEVQVEEAIYFRILTLGSAFFLVGSVVSGFFIGLGYTRPVLFANLIAAIINIPLDYMLIFGISWGEPSTGIAGTVSAASSGLTVYGKSLLAHLSIPELGIAGAAYATVAGWAFCAIVLGVGVFSKKNDAKYRVFRAWRLQPELFFRVFRFGGPSGVNLFMEVVGFAWFIFEVGKLGEVALAASNIAFSVNMLIFVPMLGLNTAVSALVGQAMGRKKPDEAYTVTISALHLSLMYMLPLCAACSLFAGPLMEIFRPADPSVDYGPIKALGILLIYYIAVYSLVDSCNIVFIGALKGAGDTLFVMLILGGTGLFTLILPIVTLKALGMAGLHSLWIVLTVYVFAMALCAFLRFRQGSWRTMRVVES